MLAAAQQSVLGPYGLAHWRVLQCVRALDLEYSTMIMGYLVLLENCDLEIHRLGSRSIACLLSMVVKAKQDLELASLPLHIPLELQQHEAASESLSQFNTQQ